MASIEEIREARLLKLELLKKNGKNPFPISTHKTHTIDEVATHFDSFVENKTTVSIAGRVVALRPQGGLIFFHMTDGTAKFQGLLKKGEDITDEDFDLFFNAIDIGDFVLVTGTVFLTNRGEKTVKVEKWEILSKSLRPLPEKWHGLSDIEERFRRRYLDLVSDDTVRARFVVRSKVIQAVRGFLDTSGFLEVETPILQALAGGATAEPFLTHHNALDIDMYLRIAPELYLKELLVGGFPKVYEIGRLFRNEGIDTTHNPEFTTVEFYEAFAEARLHRKFTEELVRHSVFYSLGTTTVSNDGTDIDFAQPFTVISFGDLLTKYTKIENIFSLSREEIQKEAEKHNISVAPGDTRAKIIDNLYKKLCRPNLIQPTYIIDYPIEFSPLAKNKEENRDMIDRFQLVVAGLEIVNAFSELNDPLEQRVRFEAQQENKKAGDAEAQPHDEEYIEAMEYGMPPAGGVGMSIDRLVMILTDTKNIREVILFPTLRPR